MFSCVSRVISSHWALVWHMRRAPKRVPVSGSICRQTISLGSFAATAVAGVDITGATVVVEAASGAVWTGACGAEAVCAAPWGATTACGSGWGALTAFWGG